MNMKNLLLSVLFAFMVSGCGGSGDVGKPVDEAEAKKAADIAAQDIKDSEVASKKAPVKKRAK